MTSRMASMAGLYIGVWPTKKKLDQESPYLLGEKFNTDRLLSQRRAL
jgi:hypothetical protein